MKIMTILGTRPEIIRLSLIIPRLDGLCEHTLVHTGQNFDTTLSDVFFDELGLRAPDHHLGVRGATAGEQIGQILARSEALMLAHKPDRLLLLGDTNSALTAIIAKRLGIAVYHMEAGNRCFDDRVPEETNRRIIDHSSDILLPYTEHSRRHLANEGIHASRIYVTGNPIAEVLTAYAPKIAASKAMEKLKLTPQGFFLVTLHRAENVDSPERLEKFLQAFRALHTQYGKPVIISTHPRLRDRLNKQQTSTDKRDGLYFMDPLGFFDFVHLQQQAFCVLSDSGTVQEEAAIFGIPNVTLRDVTERPETVECGSNILSGAEPAMIALAVKVALEGAGKALPPQDYTKANVSDTVVRILLNYRG